MPKCKNCGTRLSKFDKDICPVCGAKNPLEGVTSETVEITSQINLENSNIDNYKPCKRKTVMLLFCLIGWTGAPYFYMKKYIDAWVFMFSSIAIVAGFGTVFFCLTNLSFWSYLIVLLLDYIVNICCGALIINKPDFKDGRGEFLR